MHRWSVKKRGGQWRVYNAGAWTDTFTTLPQAHSYATANAVADELCKPGGLTCLATLRQREREWILAKHPEPLAEWEKELLYYSRQARVC